MNARITIVFIALIGVGLYALPQTMALFAGQHSFVNIDPTGNQIECAKCHGDVQAELGSSASTTTGTPGAHTAFKCEFCHRIEAGSSSGDDAYGIITYRDTAGAGIQRKLVVYVMDMEAGNIPADITSTMNVTDIRLQPTKSGAALYSNQVSASPCTPIGTCDDATNSTLLLEPESPDMRIEATYNATTHLPKDPTSTASDGFQPSNVKWETAIVRGAQTYVTNLSGAGSRVVNPGTKYHAASLVSCLECHRGEEPTGHYSRVVDSADTSNQCVKCHYGSAGDARIRTLWAGGFNLTGMAGDTGSTEAHNEFVKTSDGVTRNEYGASNGACVACHTHVAVDITYTKPTTLVFNADFGTNGTATVSGFSATGTNTSHS